ncbi:hypothetical protein [uncultured Brachyspira sp.]|uniref:hypothetical protein n=1 Tax=uncultured Brachyspira sp. TaxID=221953 RepID=UPI00262A3EB9|nr:hypothetical protein [uncultured Brachyspira sp.]
MEILLNHLLEQETSRRTILKYGTLAGISSLAGINALNTSITLPQITLSSAEISSSSISLDYTVKPYSIFLVSENMQYVNSLLSNARLEHLYLYSHTLSAGYSNKVTAYNNLSSLLLSLGSIIPFDYNTANIDMKAWKVREAFLYISGLYADMQNNSKSVINESKLLSSLKILGTYNKNIYISPNHSIYYNESIALNQASSPIGNIIML